MEKNLFDYKSSSPTGTGRPPKNTLEGGMAGSRPAREQYR